MSEVERYEVELKFPLGDQRESIAAKLPVLGAVPIKSVTQADQYFNHPQRDFAQTDEALRIRSAGSHNCLTYKGPKIDRRTKTRKEIELVIEDGEHAAQQFGELLQMLGFRPVATVRKERRSFELMRGDQSFEIALDEVTGLGSYLEIELIADSQSLLAAQQAVLDLAAELGLQEPERRSYLCMLLEQGLL